MKIEIDKYALRFTFMDGDTANLFWGDLFIGQRNEDFQAEIMKNLHRLYNECVENNLQPELEEDEE